MPNVYYVTEPVEFKITGGWVRKEKWTPKTDVANINPQVAENGTIRVVSTLLAAQTLALAKEGLKKGQGRAVLEIDYTGPALPDGDPIVTNNDGTQTVKVYPVQFDKCAPTSIYLDHIHRSLNNVPLQGAELSDSEDVALLSGSRHHAQPNRSTRIVGAIRAIPSYISNPFRSRNAEYRPGGLDHDAARPTRFARLRAGFAAAGQSLWQTAKNWGPVFLMAAAGISLFYFIGGTAALMKLGFSFGLKTAGAAALTTIGTLAVGMLSVALCKAAYKGYKGAAHYGHRGYTRATEVVVNWKANRAKSANDAEHDLVVRLAAELGRKLNDPINDPVPTAYEQAYDEFGSDEAHRAKLLQRERLLYSELRKAGDDETAQAKALAQAGTDLDAMKMHFAAERRAVLGV